jgi:acyl carrier protein
MTHEELSAAVHKFIRDNFVFDDKAQIGDDQSLLGTGIVDSTGIMEMIAFLETTFHVKFADNELVGDNFDSVSRIISFVTRKLSTPRA